MPTIERNNQNKNTRQRLGVLTILLLLILCIACGAAFYAVVLIRPNPTPKSLATQEAEAFLTETYGPTVHSAIKHYWLVANSLEANRNPTILSQVATGPWLGYRSRSPDNPSKEPFWLVTKSVSVGSVRVLEYEPGRRFKAVACVDKQNDRVTTEGQYLESLPPYRARGVYVFLYEDDAWKLAGFFETTDYDNSIRDWWYVSEWLKEIIQELPDWESCE